VAASRSPDPLLDRVVAAVGDRFEIDGELGRGGMAVVYRAREVRLRRRVALKVLPPELAFRTGVRERFLREAQTAAQLTHPHIVPVFAADDNDGIAWLAMGLVDGETLGQRMTREPRCPADEARRILSEVADALAYAHAHGVVHRDVKPDNVLLDRESGRAVVTDFGIARAAEEELRLTVTGVAVGTPAYMSPEQALGEAELDGRSDLYSLAVVGYQLITGQLPFQANSATAMLMKHVGETPRPVAALRPDVPPALAEAIDRALAKKPADRWPDAMAFRRALLDPQVGPSFGGGFAGTRPGPAAPHSAPFRDRSPSVPSESPTMAVPASPPQDVRAALAGALRQAERALGEAGGPPTASRAPVPQPSPEPQHGRQSPDDWRASQKQAEREWKEHLREQRREWRDRQRDQKEEWRAYWQDANGGRSGVPAPVPHGEVPGNAPLGGMPPRGVLASIPRPDAAAAYSPLSLERRAELFRSKAGGSILLIFFLTFINALHLFIPPWVIFPAWGITSDLRRRWRPLQAEGLRFWELMFEGAQVAVAGARTRPAGGGRTDRPLEQRVRRYRRRAKQLGVFLAIALLSLIIGVSANAEPLVVPLFLFLFLSVLAGVSLLRQGIKLRRAGVSPRDALSSGWADVVGAVDPRPRHELLAEEMGRLSAGAMLPEPLAAALRGAIEDRMVVRDTMAKLAPSDRALIPDVRPTVDALVERIAGLVQSLSRIDGDVRPGQLQELDARLALTRREPPNAPDRERKLALLERQRASLADLAQRRETMVAQLESAQLVLQNVKLDLMKLRAAGVGALAEVTSATQEARALSRDIQYALDAAAEVRAR
jgi:serine/threonine-protein kinase